MRELNKRVANYVNSSHGGARAPFPTASIMETDSASAFNLQVMTNDKIGEVCFLFVSNHLLDSFESIFSLL